jgi:hypothetical protein
MFLQTADVLIAPQLRHFILIAYGEAGDVLRKLIDKGSEYGGGIFMPARVRCTHLDQTPPSIAADSGAQTSAQAVQAHHSTPVKMTEQKTTE